jgi:hypothetical protein
MSAKQMQRRSALSNVYPSLTQLAISYYSHNNFIRLPNVFATAHGEFVLYRPDHDNLANQRHCWIETNDNRRPKVVQTDKDDAPLLA